MNATEIIKNLWMGGQWEPVLSSEFGAVVNLRVLQDLAFPLNEKMLAQQGPVSLWVPLDDNSVAPPKWKIISAVTFLWNTVSNDIKTLVHCQEGLNRSGLVVAAYLKMYMTTAEAIALVRLKRPGALSNQTFCNMLEEL